MQLLFLGEQELQGAVRVGARCRDVETEDGRDVVGRENPVVLRSVCLIGMLGRDLGDVVRVLELPFFEIRGAPGLLTERPLVVLELALGNQLIWSGQCRTDE